jgi:hypothetical protein
MIPSRLRCGLSGGRGRHLRCWGEMSCSQSRAVLRKSNLTRTVERKQIGKCYNLTTRVSTKLTGYDITSHEAGDRHGRFSAAPGWKMHSMGIPRMDRPGK